MDSGRRGRVCGGCRHLKGPGPWTLHHLRRYADQIMGKLRRPFAELIRRTKWKHRELKALGADCQLTLTTIDLEEAAST